MHKRELLGRVGGTEDERVGVERDGGAVEGGADAERVAERVADRHREGHL